MQAKIFLIVITIFGFSLWSLTKEEIKKEKTNIENKKIIKKVNEPTPNVQVKTKSYKKENKTTEIEFKAGQDLPDYQNEDELIEKSLADLEKIKQIPGARELVEELTFELERDPNKINFDAFANVGAVEVNDEFMEKMIPDEKFRAKWNQLIEIMAKNRGKGEKSEESSLEL